MPGARRWCYTLNNPKELIPFADSMRYHIYGEEVAPETGTPHYQGYVEFKKQVELSALKKLSGEAHWAPCRGDQASNIAYCKKEGKFHEEGVPGAQGHRTDLDAVKEDILAHHTKKMLYTNHFTAYARYKRNLDEMREVLLRSTEDREVEVIYLWGPTRSGKTRRAMVDRENTYRVPSPYTWWDRYDGQSTVVFDEFHGQIPITTMDEYLDRYPLDLPVKGGFVQAKYTRVWIVANVPITELYKGVPDEIRLAFQKRVNRIEYIGGDVQWDDSSPPSSPFHTDE